MANEFTTAEIREGIAPLVESGVECLTCSRLLAYIQDLLRATPTAERCLWTDEIDYWHSACGEDWCFVDGGPEENRVRFCQGCGKRVEAKGTKE